MEELVPLHRRPLVEPQERRLQSVWKGTVKPVRCGALQRAVAALPCKGDVPIRSSPNVVEPIERLVHLLDVLLGNTNGQLAVQL